MFSVKHDARSRMHFARTNARKWCMRKCSRVSFIKVSKSTFGSSATPSIPIFSRSAHFLLEAPPVCNTHTHRRYCEHKFDADSHPTVCATPTLTTTAQRLSGRTILSAHATARLATEKRANMQRGTRGTHTLIAQRRCHILCHSH